MLAGDGAEFAVEQPGPIEVLAPAEVAVAALLGIEALNCTPISFFSHFWCDHFYGTIHQPGQAGWPKIGRPSNQVGSNLSNLRIRECCWQPTQSAHDHLGLLDRNAA